MRITHSSTDTKPLAVMRSPRNTDDGRSVAPLLLTTAKSTAAALVVVTALCRLCDSHLDTSQLAIIRSAEKRS